MRDRPALTTYTWSNGWTTITFYPATQTAAITGPFSAVSVTWDELEEAIRERQRLRRAGEDDCPSRGVAREV